MSLSQDTNSDTMKRALNFTIAALDAAASLDLERSNEDRQFFAQQKQILQEMLERVSRDEERLVFHLQKERTRLQAHVLMSSNLLERGVRAAKVHMKTMLRLTMPEAADLVFGSNIAKLISGEMRTTTALVMKAIDRFENVSDFSGKQELKSSLEQRVQQLNNSLAARDEGDRLKAKLTTVLQQTIAASSNALYALEKIMLTRFIRDKVYVRQFFLEIKRVNKNTTKSDKPSTTAA